MNTSSCQGPHFLNRHFVEGFVRGGGVSHRPVLGAKGGAGENFNYSPQPFVLSGLQAPPASPMQERHSNNRFYFLQTLKSFSTFSIAVARDDL
jgi:hypothetical protein